MKKKAHTINLKHSRRWFHPASHTPHIASAANGVQPNALATSAAMTSASRYQKV
jgi:hypothetical protein